MKSQKNRQSPNRLKSILKSRMFKWVGFFGAICSAVGVFFIIYDKVYGNSYTITPIYKVSEKILNERGVPPNIVFPNLEKLKDRIHPTSYEMFKVYTKCKDDYFLDKVYDLEKSHLTIVSLILFLKGANRLDTNDLQKAIHFFSTSLIHDPTNIFSLTYLHYSIGVYVSKLILNSDFPSKKEWNEIKEGLINQKKIEKDIKRLELKNISNLYIENRLYSSINPAYFKSYETCSKNDVESAIIKVARIVESKKYDTYPYAKNIIFNKASLSPKATKPNIIDVFKSKNNSSILKRITDKFKELKESIIKKNSKGIVISVGVDKYAEEQSVPQLDFAVSDAISVSKVFSNNGYGKKILLNEHATKEKILKELKSVINRNSSGKILMLYFAGHGVCNTNGEKYILCYSEGKKNEYISIKEIEAILSMNKAKSYGVFDSCFKIKSDIVIKNYAVKLKKLSRFNKPEIILASDSYKSAYESTVIKSGLLTHALLNYLEKNYSKEVDFDTMYKEATLQTELMSSRVYKKKQTPVIFKEKNQ